VSASRAWRIAVLAVLLLATALRFHRLDAQSFWNDEGNTARLVERPLPLILEGAAGDIHPPGYYLLLRAWRAVTGETEFALRAFSAFCGVLTVAVTATIGWRAGGGATALGAAGFVALHPLGVYYSQEARMYALLGLVAAVVLWGVGGRKRWGGREALRVVLLGGAIGAGLYTQYAFVFVLLGLNLAFGLHWVTQRPRSVRRLLAWIAAHALGGALFLPWAPIALGASGWRPPDLDAGHAVAAMARALLVGITLPEGAEFRVALFAAGLLLLLALFGEARSRLTAWCAAAVALTPPALIAALGIYRPAYLKFLVASVPGLAVCLALPLASGRRDRRLSPPALLLGGALLAALVPAQATALHHLYTDPAYARDDYRGLAAAIAAAARPGDAVLLSAPNQWEVFTYYYRGPHPVHPAPYRPTAQEARAWVQEVVAAHERLFVLFWGDAESDPERRIEPLLAQHAYKAGETWVGAVRRAVYGTGPLPDRPATSVDVRLGEHIRLAGYSVPRRAYPAGDVVPLTLFWRAAGRPTERFKVFVHLLDAEGALVAQHDAEPGAGFAPTSGWAPGEQVVDRHGVLLPGDLPAGTYTLVAGMYRFSGERLTVQPGGGDSVPLAQIAVVDRRN
jgi:4-amino-4-deoxy-L-arabinose transferase-like glycosyltransferase